MGQALVTGISQSEGSSVMATLALSSSINPSIASSISIPSPVTVTVTKYDQSPTATSQMATSQVATSQVETIAAAASRINTGTVISVTSTPVATAAAAIMSPMATPLMKQPQPGSAPVSFERKGKGPFKLPTAVLGGIPNRRQDLPPTIVFLAFFVMGAISHQAIYQMNKKRGHNFVLNEIIFDFCMVRTITCVMRIVWIFRPENNSVVLAALIFNNAGVVVLFAVNTVMIQRIIRAIHPRVGWNPFVNFLFTAILASVPFIIIYNIAVLVASLFVKNAVGIEVTRVLSLIGIFYTSFLSFYPLPLLIFATALPRSRDDVPVEKFGVGRFRMKPIILAVVGTLLTIGAIIRLVSAIEDRPAFAPGELNGKGVFYATGFSLEIIVVALYLVLRIDLRFHVPDGAKGPGDYSPKAKVITRLDDPEDVYQSEFDDLKEYRFEVQERDENGQEKEKMEYRGYGQETERVLRAMERSK